MDETQTYVNDSSAPAQRTAKRGAVYIGLAVLLAAASLVAANSRGGTPSKFPRVLVPGSGGACSTPPNGFLFSKGVDGVRMIVCISQEGNINQIQYPDTATGHTQLAFDGYCLVDTNTGTTYKDYSSGAGIFSLGWGAATLIQQADNQLSMTRDSTDGKFQLTEFIKINFQPRSIFVAMTVKNLDSTTHQVFATREVAPAIDGNAANDQYNQFAPGIATGIGRTGLAWNDPTGSDMLAFGPTQKTGFVGSAAVANFQAGGGCGNYGVQFGNFGGGNRVLLGEMGASPSSLAPGASASLGKFVYRMM